MDLSRFLAQYGLDLTAQQTAAVQAVEGPVLLLAVPGSGKTTVLVARLGYMLHEAGIPPEHILTMTYTVAAARDMARRYAALFGQAEAQQLEFRTINGVCSRIIRRCGQLCGRPAFGLLEDGGRKSALIGQLYRSQTGEFATESTVKALQTAITYAKNQMLGEEELAEVEAEGVDFPAFFRAYGQALRRQRLMDYDDQMVYAYRILHRYPQILQDARQRWRYLCVDEAQDTSRIQHAVIETLAGRGGNLFMVGDEDQSIYGFRAACPQALMDFRRVHPGARVLYMEDNHRSAAPIVEAADRFIRKNRSRHPKHMRATRGGGPPIREITVYDRQSQYRYLSRVAEDCAVETAVLYRDNDSALPLLDLLDRAGLPYRCRQLESLFFSSRVVRDVTNIIRFARNPGDGELFLDLYYKLGAGISRPMALEAAARASGPQGDLLAYVAEMPAASPWTRRQCRALRTHMDSLLRERGDNAVYRIVHFMGYGAYLEERGGDLNKTAVLEALGAQEPTPERLLERLEALREVVQAGSTDPACPFVLSTIHSSKGLEYPRVVLADVADGLLPRSVPRPGADQAELDAYEEERRLFYVGMTRAREELWIFTFRRSGLESSFAREILPPQEKDRPAPPPLPASSRPDARRLAAQARVYVPGTAVAHRTFGHGTLVSRSGDIAIISFEDGEVRRIALSAALRAGQLRPD